MILKRLGIAAIFAAQIFSHSAISAERNSEGTAQAQVDTKLTRYQSQVISRLKPCADGSQPEALQKSQFFKVGDKKYIVEVMCFLAAYQGSYEYYLYRETAGQVQTKPLKLVQFNDNKSRIIDNAIAGLPTYNAAKKELSFFTKYRGVGDCGSYGRYRFENDQLVLKEFRVKSACDGRAIDPKNYPQVYP